MTGRHLVDPDLLPLLDLYPTVTVTMDNLAERRARRLPVDPVRDDRVTLDVLRVPGPKGAPPIGLHVYRAVEPTEPLPILYHIHGGGHITGSAAVLEALHRPLAAALGCAIVSVDYRLSPETVFPGAIEDCYAGLGWTIAHAARWGLAVDQIGVLGESAGGGLAAALTLLARDRGEYRLAFQHLIAPMLDDRTCTSAEPHPHAGQFGWHAANNRFAWTAMLGQEPGGETVSPYAAPARAISLAGLPPAYLSVGALDLFLEEVLDYARRLGRAGVPVELHVWPGAIHGFELFGDAAIAQRANRASQDALRRSLGD